MKKACPFYVSFGVLGQDSKRPSCACTRDELGPGCRATCRRQLLRQFAPDSHRWKSPVKRTPVEVSVVHVDSAAVQVPSHAGLQVSLPSASGQVSVSPLSLSPGHVGPQVSVVSPLSLSHRHVGTQVSVVSPLSLSPGHVGTQVSVVSPLSPSRRNTGLVSLVERGPCKEGSLK